MRGGGLAAAALMIVAAALVGGSSGSEASEGTVGAPDPVSARPAAPVRPPTPRLAPPAPDVSCTDQVNYAGDTRSNAEINSAGERTGSCPLPQK